MKIIFPILSALASICIATTSISCNSTENQPESPYKIENNQYVSKISKDPSYTVLNFNLEEYPIYYKVLKDAPDVNRNKRPLQNSTVSIYISGKLINGFNFEPRSPKPVETAIYNIVNGKQESLIKGVQIALQNMEVGARWEVVIPWQLGYGGYTYNTIPGYSTLIFDIELVDIVK